MGGKVGGEGREVRQGHGEVGGLTLALSLFVFIFVTVPLKYIFVFVFTCGDSRQVK